MIGRNTGMRHMGSDPGRYCRLREEWMSAGDCASCVDFDPAEEARDDQCGGRCRHCHPDPDGESNGDSRQDDQSEQDG
jgi:hypothetical protein